MTLGCRLKQARESRNYAQEGLAQAIGVSRGVITNLEHDKTGPQPLVIRAICRELRINEDWLLTGQGPMETNTATEMFSEICGLAGAMSEDEQLYILEMIKAFVRYRNKGGKE